MPNAFGYKIAVPFDECVFYSVNNQINPAFKHYLRPTDFHGNVPAGRRPRKTP